MFNLRKVTNDDIRLLFDWSNDNDVRANAINSNPITWDEHVIWFDERLNNTSTYIYILTNLKHDVGVVRFDKKLDNFIISYSIDKNYRGQGLGLFILQEGLKKISEIFNNPCIVAYVKEDNIASNKLFVKIGFNLNKKEIINDINFNIYTNKMKKIPFIIAEMSGNHNQSLDRALAIVDAAAEAGAHALKLQTYTADTITMKNVYTIVDKKSLWAGRDLYDLYQEAHTPWEWHKAIFDRAKEKGIICFSTPFDETAVDFLEELDAPIYKVASFEVNHIPLLKYIAKTGKPVIISVGASTLQEIELAIKTLKDNGCNDLTILKCTSTYPASPEDTNLLTIPDMAKLFNCKVGLSDHTMGIGVSIAAVALGAEVIEKHFCLNRDEGGVDSAFSLEPQELKSLVEELERAYLSLGKVNYDILPAEENSRIFKRSIYASEDIKIGDKFTCDNMKIVRPSFGLEPKYFESQLGKISNKYFKKGEPITE